jgi:hypothetical protein
MNIFSTFCLIIIGLYVILLVLFPHDNQKIDLPKSTNAVGNSVLRNIPIGFGQSGNAVGHHVGKNITSGFCPLIKNHSTDIIIGGGIDSALPICDKNIGIGCKAGRAIAVNPKVNRKGFINR